MRRITLKNGLIILTMLFSGFGLHAQDTTIWTLDKCIDYALEHNITVQKAALSTQQSEINLTQSKSNRLPSVSASVGQNFNMSRSIETSTNTYGDFSGSSNTSYGVNAGMTLFNGFKLNTQIEQAKLNLESAMYYSETITESVELNILNAYLQILYAQEEVTNAENQIKSTTEQLSYAAERLDLGIISKSDYLQIKSELASEKLTLANAQSNLTIAKVSLMQLMELPVTSSFDIASPNLSDFLTFAESPDANTIYQKALDFKPQIKEAELNTESTKLNEKIAKADLLPSLSVNGSVSTGWSSGVSGYSYGSQLNNNLTPALGLSLSIPIFQKNQVKNNIKLAQLDVNNAKLTETDTKNSLRKEIEQAAVDVVTAQSQYEASEEKYSATTESYEVSSEKYELGILNSVDFLIEKTNLITAESNLLQAKYNFIFSLKILDYYKGKPITL